MKVWKVVLQFTDYRADDKELALDETKLREILHDRLSGELPDTIGYSIVGIAQPYDVKGAGR